MQTYHLRCEALTERSIEETFAVFQDPRNLAKITPSWLKFEVLTQGVEMRQGAEIEYNIRWLGLPMHWKTLITEYRPPFWFVDEQAEGPYALWRHQHTFETGPQGTKIGDHVEYALPLGVLGKLAHAAMVKKQLNGIFEFRLRAMGKLLGAKVVKVKAPEISAA